MTKKANMGSSIKTRGKELVAWKVLNCLLGITVAVSTGEGLKIPLWKKEPGELPDEEVEVGDNEEDEDSNERDSDEAEKTSPKEGEYWELGQELQDGDGKDKGSVSYCPLRQETSVPEVSGLRRSESGFWTWLSPLTLLSSFAFTVDRKRILPGEVCLREKQQSNEGPCSRCEILFCRKCETLHCDPNYVEHCILDHWEGGVSDQEELEGEQISPSQETILFMTPPVMDDIQ